jgi:hypothetical protein
MGRLLPARVIRISSRGPGRSKGAVAAEAIDETKTSIVTAGRPARNHERQFIVPILWKYDQSFIPCTEIDTKNFGQKWVKSAMIAEKNTIGTEQFGNGTDSKARTSGL